MRHKHIGVLDGTVLVFGGPYSNAQATTAVLAQAAVLGIAPSHVICTGDVVAYCGAPGRTVAAIRASDCTVVAGNCEVQLAAGAIDCGCGFEEGSACDVLSARWFSYASKHVRDADRSWMRRLPDIATFDHCGARYAVVHGGVTDVARFIWDSSDDAVFDEEWNEIERFVGPVDHVIAGHCGVPFVKTTSRGRWMNAGVIGMPPHDGGVDTRFALLEQDAFVVRPLTYDVAGAVADMETAGLTQGYADALRTGYWPSQDVLPQGLRVSGFAKG
ncbi:metallophosphoesterase family protein [Pseudosulfitobacter sp. SM2401]|uniref:metallophosphoesterase family protein n=1 Tax=Pseudosulfitobacter sp. SM2401 TaxID=3350098 RepID=UPI0036F361E0